MRKKNFIFLAFLQIVLIASCTRLKETDSDEISKTVVGDRNTDDFALTTQDVQVQNGVLCFTDSTALRRVLASLESLNADAVFRQNHLASQGVTSPNSPADYAYNYEPASHAFAMRFGLFKSLHMYNEDIEYQHLESGGALETIPEGKIDDYELQKVVNQYGEIKIGNLIFRQTDEIFLVVTNSDWGQLQMLRSHPDVTSVFNLKNIRRIDRYAPADEERLKIMESKSRGGGGQENGDCDPWITVSKINETTYKAKNTSVFYNCQYNSIEWTIVDANNNILYTASNVEEVTYSAPANVAVPVRVTMTFGGGCCEGSVTDNLISADCSEGDALSLAIVSRGLGFDHTYVVLNTEALGGNYTIAWDFGDGSPIELVSNNPRVTHLYLKDYVKWLIISSPLTIPAIEIKATITWGNGCTKQIALSELLGCGIRTTETVKLVPRPANNI